MIPAAQAASLMGWWRDAGVDTLIDEVPVPWLERAAAKPVQIAAPPKPAEKPATDPMPASLETFAKWLVTSPAIPDAGPPQRRIGPTGTAGAALMVLVDMPEAVDARAGQILSGESGETFDRMLTAIKLDRSDIWLATLCPGRPPSGMFDIGAEERLAEIARHHVALAAPEKLWLMGAAASRAILGMDWLKARGSLHDFNHKGGTVKTIASFHPRFLNENPARKRDAWKDMQILFGESAG